MDTQKEPSTELLAANERLYRLRAEAKAQREADAGGGGTAVFPRENKAPGEPSVNGRHACPPENAPSGHFCISPQKGVVQTKEAHVFPREKLSDLPDHVGWGSQVLTDHLRQIEARKQAEVEAEQRHQEFVAWQAEVDAELVATAYLRDCINIFGHTLDAIARDGRVGDGRVWLLARYIDKDSGEGRVSIDLLKKKLVNEWKVLSWKRLRQIMKSGEGIFWHRDKRGEHFYYHSEARVAKAHGVGQLNGFAVAIPVKDLLGNIKTVRALFYDGFHSAREEGFGNPITRGTMARRGNGDGRTQRDYEELRGIESKANYVNVDLYNKERWMWEKGREDVIGLPLGPAFRHIDFNGRLGHNPNRKHRKPSQQHWHNIYIMRRMANSYDGTLPTVKRGRKWTNRKLENLCCSMHAFSMGSFEEYEAIQIYHSTEKKADRFHRKQRDDVDAYYPQAVAQAQGESDVWRVYGRGAAEE